MRAIDLNPNQIITLNDYPVHSDKILINYFSKCKSGKDIAFVPVIPKDVVKKHLNYDLLKKFERFQHRNPDAKYFMLDGSHRTTALNLAGCRIKAIIYKKDKDISEARKLIETGQILESDIDNCMACVLFILQLSIWKTAAIWAINHAVIHTLNHSLKENCEILLKHFKEKPYFMTVEQKTIKMVKDGFLTKKMIDSYRRVVKKKLEH